MHLPRRPMLLALAVLAAHLVAQCGTPPAARPAEPPSSIRPSATAGNAPTSAPTTLVRPDAPQTPAGARLPSYPVGDPAYVDIVVSPAGDDAQEGADAGSAARPFRSIQRAWRAVEHDAGDMRRHAYRILLEPGEYCGAYLDRETAEQRSGATPATPLLITSADPDRRARIVFHSDVEGCNRANITIFQADYVYLTDFDIRLDRTWDDVPVDGSTGDGFQCERCRHVLLRNMRISGFFSEDDYSQTETVKLNQSEHIYIEDSEISGGGDNAIDAVGVRHGWWVRNVIHHARDWCLYAKGGSADILIEANLVSDCGTGGILAGQGTTMPFLVAPFLQYEAYHIVVANNIIHDVRGAGLGVNGGFNILFAYNTIVRAGNDENRNQLLELAPGVRDCAVGEPSDEQPDPARGCRDALAAGAWGWTRADHGEFVPNRNVFVLNNLIVNPDTISPIRLFRVDAPRDPESDWSGPRPARFDEGLVVQGNIIATGGAEFTLDVAADRCGDATCNEAQLLADNQINAAAPMQWFIGDADYHPSGDSPAVTLAPRAMPTFDTSPLDDAQRELATVVTGAPHPITHDYYGVSRSRDAIGAVVP
ncbi:MAG: right-handed parallel beta-helix repeat-containing protein [Chloroflexi bacterium]|nr:right-handed parallel beta-helix repeat-containing protein [Chloroflexota bacterium]